MGYAVGLTTRGTRAVDMVATNSNTGKSITIQTKTMLNAFVKSRKWGHYWKWRVSISPQPAHETFFYTFVDLKDNPSETPDVFIVPSGELIPPLLEEYRNDNWCVIYEKDAPRYRDRWDVIKNALA